MCGWDVLQTPQQLTVSVKGLKEPQSKEGHGLQPLHTNSYLASQPSYEGGSIPLLPGIAAKAERG